MRQPAAHFLATASMLALATGLAPGAYAFAADGAVAWQQQPSQQQAPQQPLPTTYPEIRKLYEAGKYQQVIDAVAALTQPQPPPPVIYIAGLAHEKLQQPVRANQRFAQLSANRPETNAWVFVGRSATSLNQTPKRVDESIAAARRAIELEAQNPHAHYQLGLALSNKRDYAGASQAFARVTELDPANAYAHYYAGLSFYQVRRIDQVAKHFEAFLRLAPEAPERGQVASIMRTIRG